MNVKSKNIIIYPVSNRTIHIPEGYLGKLNLEQNITQQKRNLTDNKSYALSENLLSLDGNKLTLNANKFIINGYEINILKPITTSLTSYFGSTDLWIYLSIELESDELKINNIDIPIEQLNGIDTINNVYNGVNLLTSQTLVNQETTNPENNNPIYNLILGIIHYDLDNGWILLENNNVSTKQNFGNIMIENIQSNTNLGNMWLENFILDDGEIE